LEEEFIGNATEVQCRFRWVSLQVYLLSVAKTKEALEDGLKDLPKDLRDSYKRTYDQMLSLNQKEIFLAHRTIQWLLCAKASLKMDEIIDAVCIGMRIQFPDFRHRPSKEEVLSVCQNLVVVDEELAIFRLAHLSVREFFETVEGFRPNELNTNALDTCISRLLDHDTRILDSHLSHTPGFEKYAIRYWIRHCEELGCAGPEEPTRSRVKDFIHHDLSPTKHFETWKAKFQAQTTKTEEEEREINDGKTQDAFLAFFACIRGFLWLIDDQVSNLHWNAFNSGGDTLLIVTSIYGHPEFLEFLLELGAEVNMTGFESRTALHMAARHGHLKCVVKLLEHGADINALQSGAKVGGQTSLHEAVGHHHKEVVQHLLDRGADVEAREGKNDRTPLFLACSTIEITRLLLHRGAKINARDADEETPLHLALWHATSPNVGSSGLTHSVAASVAAILIENGADIFAMRRDGITPFHWAAKEPTILDFVLSKVQSLENVRHLIETSLSQAVMANSPACLDVLLRRGLNVSVKDVSGKTPLDFALELGSPEMLSKLLQYHPVPGLRWDLDSEFIQNWKEKNWFKALEVQIKSASIPRMFVHQFFSYKEAKREDLLRYDRNTPNLPYLQLTVPAEFDSVQGVVFRIVSHDQGIYLPRTYCN
jgi:ankyrin repeat protein